MSIKGASIIAIEHFDNVVIEQYNSKIKINNINDINIMIDILNRLKNRYYSAVSDQFSDVYINYNEQGSERKTRQTS
jgi:hypothetical protein